MWVDTLNNNSKKKIIIKYLEISFCWKTKACNHQQALIIYSFWDFLFEYDAKKKISLLLNHFSKNLEIFYASFSLFVMKLKQIQQNINTEIEIFLAFLRSINADISFASFLMQSSCKFSYFYFRDGYLFIAIRLWSPWV